MDAHALQIHENTDARNVQLLEDRTFVQQLPLRLYLYTTSRTELGEGDGAQEAGPPISPQQTPTAILSGGVLSGQPISSCTAAVGLSIHPCRMEQQRAQAPRERRAKTRRCGRVPRWAAKKDARKGRRTSSK